MQTVLLNAHSGWRYIVILVGLLAIANMVWGWLGKRPWTGRDRQIGLIASTVVDIQVLLGIVLWIVEQRWLRLAELVPSIEHPILMLAAVVVVHIGWPRARRAEPDEAKFRVASLTYIAAGLLIALGIAQVTGMF